jgi:hypothetical protein
MAGHGSEMPGPVDGQIQIGSHFRSAGSNFLVGVGALRG